MESQTGGEVPAMKIAMLTRKRLVSLSILFLFLLCFALAYLFPSGCSDETRRRLRRLFVIRQYVSLISEYQVAHDDQLPKSIIDVLETTTNVDYRCQQMMCCDFEQGWKPAGWYMDNDIAAIYSDYVFIPIGKTHLIVSERISNVMDDEVDYTVVASPMSENPLTNSYPIISVKTRDLKGIRDASTWMVQEFRRRLKLP